jgi:hypothetical protein
MALFPVNRAHAVFSENKGRISPYEGTDRAFLWGSHPNTGFQEWKYRDDRIPFLCCLFFSEGKQMDFGG